MEKASQILRLIREVSSDVINAFRTNAAYTVRPAISTQPPPGKNRSKISIS